MLQSKKTSSWSILLKGLLLENPVFVLILGTCPTLATTTSVIGALGMGLAAAAVLVCSNAVISLLRKVIPDMVRIPCYIVIIAGFVTVVQMLMHAFLPDMYDLLGVYLALITVNCIILGRAEMFAGKNSVGKSVLDGIGMGLGFTLALLSMATIREVFGNGSFAGMEIPFLADHKISILVKAPGGMLVYGLLIALVTYITKGRFPKKKSFDCEGCPSAGMCRTGEANACSGCACVPSGEASPKESGKTGTMMSGTVSSGTVSSGTVSSGTVSSPVPDDSGNTVKPTPQRKTPPEERKVP